MTKFSRVDEISRSFQLDGAFRVIWINLIYAFQKYKIKRIILSVLVNLRKARTNDTDIFMYKIKNSPASMYETLESKNKK